MTISSYEPLPARQAGTASIPEAAAIATLPAAELVRLLADAARRDDTLRVRLVAALEATAAEPPRGTDDFMVGSSSAMLDVFDRCRRFAAVDAPVLITGESGTGKELAARAIHERSTRSAGPFVAINCAALPPNLVNAELFGHEKGAFTGAVDRRPGHIELAHGGTLFLDEVGDLPAEVQGHLLRFLQDGLVTRLGGRKATRVDCRIVAATHVPLREAMQTRRFREDLYYRLAVLTLEMPPLRTRGEDIELLATVFLERICREFGRPRLSFAPEALAALHRHAWPGNVRELIAVLRRAAVMSNGPLLRPADLALDASTLPTAATPARRSPTDPGAERARLLAALQASGHSVAGAARALGVSRVTLYRMMARHGVEPRR